MQKNAKCRRLTAFLLSCLLVLESLPLLSAPAAAAGTVAKQNGVLAFHTGAANAASIPYTQTLSENGSGGYTWTLTLDPRNSLNDQSQNSAAAQDGYFTAQLAGDYLVELWGGKGGEGEGGVNIKKDLFRSGDGGQGGAAGHVYGVVHLNVGDTLFYTIGGNGATTLSGGGGANQGASHGDEGGRLIGSGGGYSALFLYGPGEFDSYLNPDGTMISGGISEADRTSRVIMIAGGGGGGGAGNGLTGRRSTLIANGGAGGSVGGASVLIAGLGTCYPGADGSSSGTDTGYIGQGGSTYPGANASTYFGTVDSSSGKDWSEGGAGGDGNLRGGAGGAGYCGGGGGNMPTRVTANNVGGGGGGSSFIADSVSLASVPPENLRNVNPAEDGGAVFITNLGSGEETANYSYLENLTISGTVSDYFGVSSGASVSGNDWSVSSLSLFNNEGNVQPVTVTLTLTPKTGFAGGNDVPLFGSTPVVSVTPSSESAQTVDIPDDCGYVNVPLAFKAIGNTCVYDQTADSPDAVHGTYLYTADDMYKGAKAATPGTMYDFIASVTDYQIDGGTPAASYAPEADTAYAVSFTVTPTASTGKAVVGPVQETTTFSARAAITVKQRADGTLNGNPISVTKTLTESDGTYTLSFEFSSQVKEPKTAGGTVTVPSSHSKQEFASSGTYTAPEDGYYLVQVWGADGGKGGDAKYTVPIVGHTREGGPGGHGGYSSNTIYLEADQLLSVAVGSQGTNITTTASNGVAALGSGGGGGGASYVSATFGGHGQQIAAIAGGGGGGGGAYASSLTTMGGGEGGEGGSSSGCTSVSGLTTASSGGQSGADATALGGHGEGGAAGTSYQNTLVESTPTGGFSTASQSILANSDSTRPDAAGANGYAIITPLDYETTAQVIDPQPYDLFTAEISQYFSIDSENISVTGAAPGTVSVGTDNVLTIANIVPTAGAETGDPAYRPVSFTISVPLTPKDGFLGGNDVPVLEGEATLEQMDFNSVNTDDLFTVEAKDSTDYANVDVPEVAPTLSATDAVYVLGYTGLNESDLFTYEPFSPAEIWMAEYVNISADCAETGPFAPSEDTTYTYTFSVAPKASPSSALVKPEAAPFETSVTALVTVKTSVAYVLDNLSVNETLDSDDKVVLERNGLDYTATLSPAGNYLLPTALSSVTYKVMTGDGDDVTSQCSYDPLTGQLTIPGSILLEHSVIVTAAADDPPPETYKIVYYWQTDPEDTVGLGFAQYEYEPDATIPDEAKPGSNGPADVPGYTFAWDHDDFPVTMPANDLYYIGTFTPDRYTLTIHYTGTSDSIDDYTETVFIGDTYSVNSPVIDGYVANTPVVTGTVTGNTEITVTYTPLENDLIIYYQYEDGSQAEETHREKIDTGADFSVTSPVIPGYTCSEATVSGTMSATGYIATVTYTGNDVTVTFASDGGSACEGRTVQYGNLLGWCKTSTGFDSFQALPTPVKAGYRFLGWKLNGSYVSTNTVVASEGPITLTADWAAITYTVTVYFVGREDNETLADPVQRSGSVGEDYEVSVPTVTGYSAETPGSKSGTFIAANQSFTIYYTINSYTLTIHYLDANDHSVQIEDTFSDTVKYKSFYSVASPAVPSGYESCSQPVVSGYMPANNVEVTVLYYKTAVIVCVTVSWDSLTFTYTESNWDPISHSYTTTTFAPENPKVTVTNSNVSNISVHAAVAYTPVPSFSGIAVALGKADMDLAPNSSDSCTITPSGRMPSGVRSGNTYTIGTVTVTITGG